jgi:hypothetical protein
MKLASLLGLTAVLLSTIGALAQDQSCESLWLRRNEIFRSAGYCFKTPKAIAAFGNSGCKFDEIADLPLSDRDRDAISEIAKVEIVKQCGTATTSPASRASSPPIRFVRPEVPIVIQATDTASCASGVVTGLDPRGDGFLAVKSGPHLKFSRIDQLFNGQSVYLCEARGDWIGIVYPTESRCGVGPTAWSVTDSYSGPCSSGWVHKAWIRGTAG